MTMRLHFHLGPVHGFIGQARRTRDVWAGSFLLSWLSAQAMVAALGDKGEPGAIESPEVGNDPVFNAVFARARGLPYDGRPFLGTLTNHFKVTGVDGDAGRRAAKAVRANWVALANAVRGMFPGMTPEAAALWREQIGSDDQSPLWETSWVVLPAGSTDDDGERWLRARKRTRLPPSVTSSVREGNFCTMMDGWLELSREIRTVTGSKQRAFWQGVAHDTIRLRYGGAGIERGYDCLDLRPGEQLCAPALVKRLFPLLAFVPAQETSSASRLADVIGWEPFSRAADVEMSEVGRAPRSWAERFRAFWSGNLPTTASPRAQEREERSYLQHPVLWPSTSYIAAAPWIGRARREASLEARAFAAAIAPLGRHLSRAEHSVWLRCVDDGSDPSTADFAAVDGAMMFASSLAKQATDVGPPRGARAVKAQDALRKKMGAPPPECYALLRVDGDRMGSKIAANPSLSAALNTFTLRLRGTAQAVHPDAADDDLKAIGVIAAHSGIVLYAGADEMLALFPVEYALPAALAVRQTFAETVGAIDSSSTLSTALTLAHRQVPLRWVVDANHELLELTAKGTAGRDAFAAEMFDSGGRYGDWVAPWSATPYRAPVEALARLLRRACTDVPSLASNAFFHECATVLRAFLVAEESSAYAERLAAATAQRAERAAVPGPLIEHLLSDVLASQPELRRATPEVLADLVQDVIALSSVFGRDRADQKPVRFAGCMSLHGLRLLRSMASNIDRTPRMPMNPTERG